MRFVITCSVLASALLAGCGSNTNTNANDGGVGDGGTGGGGALAWTLKLSAIVQTAASAVVGTDSVLDPGGGYSSLDLPTNHTYHAARSTTAASADATLTVAIDDHQLTLTATETTTGPTGTGAPGAAGSIRDLSVCITAPAGVTKIRITYACAATAQFSGHGGAALTVTAGSINYCIISNIEGDVPHDQRFTLVQEIPYGGGTDCWNEGTDFAFTAGGGNASVSGTASVRFDPVY